MLVTSFTVSHAPANPRTIRTMIYFILLQSSTDGVLVFPKAVPTAEHSGQRYELSQAYQHPVETVSDILACWQTMSDARRAMVDSPHNAPNHKRRLSHILELDPAVAKSVLDVTNKTRYPRVWQRSQHYYCGSQHRAQVEHESKWPSAFKFEFSKSKANTLLTGMAITSFNHPHLTPICLCTLPLLFLNPCPKSYACEI